MCKKEHGKAEMVNLVQLSKDMNAKKSKESVKTWICDKC